ncbi:hypothetical protein PHISCL_05777 [Aspergillus sclerotialis]|uniref:DUF6594 domain-containing protein n=1 Tax=Aspergillus sclerotialis TaxID=2070753 RepID=A0A3A2ZFF2_9EURO|nr:hypothetical protein PHISCL_05777 [Aspergillus sclerotialis]
MPLHSGFGRSKKPRKDTTKRASTTAITSPNSHPASKVSVASAERPKKENPQAPLGTNRDPSQKTPAWLQGKPAEVKKRAPDVFDFLDDGGSDVDSLDNDHDRTQNITKPKTTTTTSAAHPGQNARAQTNPGWHQWAFDPSQTSSEVTKGSTDSRTSPISPDTSPATVQLQLAKKNSSQRKPSIAESHNTADSLAEESLLSKEWDLSVPEAYYPSPKPAASMHRPPLPPSPPRSPKENSGGNRKSKKNSKSSHVLSGYGLLASHLTSSDDFDHTPLYRRFENLNHRVLLHLQDEIAQMEEDLHVLDEYEEVHRAAEAEHQGTKVMLASRRMDAHAQVYSSLHYRRQELIGAIIQKTEQYNNALTAYSRVLHTLPRASDQDIKNYRAWMKEKTPVAPAETRFLDHNDDLVSLSPRAGVHPSTTPVYSAIVIASAAILMPLLAFSMISEFSGRLIVVTVVGGAAAAIASNYSTGAERLVDSRDGWRCATV